MSLAGKSPKVPNSYSGGPRLKGSTPMYILHNKDTGRTAITELQAKPDKPDFLADRFISDRDDLGGTGDWSAPNLFDLVMPYYIHAQPFVMFHDTESHSYMWCKVPDELPSPGGFEILKQETWQASFDCLQYVHHPDFAPSKALYFGHSNESGLIAFTSIDEGANLEDVFIDHWQAQFHTVTPYYMNGGWPHFLIVRDKGQSRSDPGTGIPELCFCRCNEGGNAWEDLAVTGMFWEQGNHDGVFPSHVISWEWKGRPLMFAHDIVSGASCVFSIKKDGTTTKCLWEQDFPGQSGFQVITPLSYGKRNYFLCHNPDENYYGFCQVNKYGLDILKEDTWSTAATQVSAFQHGADFVDSDESDWDSDSWDVEEERAKLEEAKQHIIDARNAVKFAQDALAEARRLVDEKKIKKDDAEGDYNEKKGLYEESQRELEATTSAAMDEARAALERVQGSSFCDTICHGELPGDSDGIMNMQQGLGEIAELAAAAQDILQKAAEAMDMSNPNEDGYTHSGEYYESAQAEFNDAESAFDACQVALDDAVKMLDDAIAGLDG